MKLLDTDVCIAFSKGADRPLMLRLKDHRTELAICSVVKAELLFGARGSKDVERSLKVLEPLFLNTPSLPFDDLAAEQYGVIRAQLERAGTPIGPNDMMIAAIALVHDATVITRNIGEFTRVQGLRVERW